MQILAGSFVPRIVVASETVQFSPTTYMPSEEVGTFDLTVTRSGSALTRLEISFTTVNGTAVSGTDYTAISGPNLVWEAGEIGNKTITITLTDRDGVEQGNLVFTCVLTKVSGDDTLSNGTATITIQDQDANPHPQEHSSSFLLCQGAINTRLVDNSHPMNVLFGVVDDTLFQPQLIWNGSRAVRMGLIRDFWKINPLQVWTLHNPPFHSWPGFNLKEAHKWHALSKFLQTINRTDAMVFRNATSTPSNPALNRDEEINIGGQNNSFNSSKQGQFLLNITKSLVYNEYAKIMADVLVGTQVSTFTPSSLNGEDMSDIMRIMSDGTGLVIPKTLNGLEGVLLSGSVASIDGTEGNSPGEATIVTLDGDPGIPVEANDLPIGRVNGDSPAIPAGMKEVTEVHSVGFAPKGNSKTYVCRQIIGAKGSQIYLKPFSNTANSNQPQDSALRASPTDWAYAVSDPSTSTTNVDWTADGTPENFMAGAVLTAAAITSYKAAIGAACVIAGGQNVLSYGGNISQGLTQKRSSIGYATSPHPFTGLMETPHGENFSPSNAKIAPREDGTHGYEADTSDTARMMKQMYFGASHVPDSVSDWCKTKPYGFIPEITMYSQNYYGYVPYTSMTTANKKLMAQDFSLYAMFWAVAKTVPKVSVPNMNMESGGGLTSESALISEVVFLDCDTNWSTPAPLGTYTEGGTDNAGNVDTGSWAWTADDAGAGNFINLGFFRILFARRFGDFVVFMNLSSAKDDNQSLSSGFDYVRPLHLDNPWVTRTANDEDVFTVADMAAMASAGTIYTSGETLTRVDFATYNNALRKAYYDAHADAGPIWDSYTGGCGPRLPHPADGASFTVANTPAILRDDIWYDNTSKVLNQSVDFPVAPLTAYIFKAT